MGAIHEKRNIEKNVKQPDFDNKGKKRERDLKIHKVVKIILIILAAALVVTGVLALAAVFLPLQAIAAGAFIAFAVVSVINAVAFGTFALIKGLDYIAPKLPRPLNKFAHVIHAAITETLSVLVMSACYFVNLEKQNPKKVEGNDQKPILLIHGLYHNSSAWIEYLDQMKASHVGPVFTINMGDIFFGSIDDHAEKVKKKVEEIQKITGRKDIMLVGHSMGGLVASKFALDLASEDTEVTDIVTIGSPLKGTPVANYIGLGKDAREMRKGSEYVKNLSNKIIEQAKINFFHIASETDELVPTGSALLQENNRAVRLILPNLGHCGLLYSKTIIDAIIEHYKNPPVFV